MVTINVALRRSSASNFRSATFDSDDDEGGGACNTQQETNTYGNDDCVMVFPDHDACAVPSMGSTPQSVLVPLAKELAQILERNCSPDELQQYKHFLSSAITKKKIGISECKQGTTTWQNGVIKCVI
jgi:hypothetical protein